MGGSAARLRMPGYIIAASLGLAACAGPHQGPAAQNGADNSGGASNVSLTEPANTPNALALSMVAPADLTGLDGPSLERLFGKPSLVRHDYPAEVWQYRNPACVLDVYLYSDNDHLTVTHAEARAPKIASDPMRPCIAKFAELRQKTTG
jgi:hypothetical protein